MNTVIEMAREAGGIGRYFGEGKEGLAFHTVEELERFAALVRKDEREACAKVCEARYMGDNNREDMEAKRCAAAIRAKSQPLG